MRGHYTAFPLAGAASYRSQPPRAAGSTALERLRSLTDRRSRLKRLWICYRNELRVSMSSTPPLSDRFLRVDAAAAADGSGLSVAPASILLQLGDEDKAEGVRTGRLIIRAIGSPKEVSACPEAKGAEVIRRPDCLLTPAFVNAHAHLDLTHIGPRPFEASQGFGGFVDLVRRGRAGDEPGIAASVRAGIAHLLRGGVVAVGDIAGAPAGKPSLVPYKTVAASPLGGVSFVEFFAIGKGEAGGRKAISSALGSVGTEPANPVLPLRLGIQPHAPTTVALATYRWLMERAGGVPLSTHLAETPEEREFVAHGGGPQRAFMESLGLWEDSIVRASDGVGQGKSPTRHLASVLAASPFVCAHVNDASDEDIAILSRTLTSIAYCPRASDYFRAQDHFGAHRYREMLEAGINVALGTDSIVNLPDGTSRLSTLDEARFLYQRDGTDPLVLLQMATLNGARALELDEDCFAFEVGSPLAGLVAVPIALSKAQSALAAALSSQSAPELLLVGK
jgi:cytosine/adenosine deaminase-related metal-dependent hydrolase